MAALVLERVGILQVVRFAPARLGVFARQVSGDDGRMTPTDPREVLARSDADAALDGPMFSNCGSGGYAGTACERPDYLLFDMSRNVQASGSHPDTGITVSVSGGQAVVMDGAHIAPGARVAVQLYPTLVRRGRAVGSGSGEGAEVTWRAGLAVLASGELAFAVARAPLDVFSRALVDLGAMDAGYTDGGGSTALVTPRETAGSSEHRRVPAFLVVNREGMGAGMGSALPWLLALGAGGLTYWWMTRERRR